MISRKQLAAIVPSGNVTRSQKVLDAYSGDASFVNPVRPDCVVKMRSADDAVKLVELARTTRTPLVPVSSGSPHFRGDTVPGVGGAVIADFSGMKNIIRVDRVNRTVVFEPGVTFGELIAAATGEGLRLNLPLLPRQSKSVVGSLLEREPVVMPKYHWDIADPLQCVEVIFGTGDKFRTGAAAGPGDLEEQWQAGGGQVEAAGPSTASWYRIVSGSQGTMGLVTWASARCEILPELEEPYMVGSDNLEALMEMAHWLIRNRIPNECFILNSMNLALIMAGDFPDDCRNIKASLPPWVLFYNLAGYRYLPEQRVSVYREDAQKIAQRVQVEPARSAGKVSAFDLLKVVQAPSEEPYWKLRAGGQCHDIFFINDYQGVPGSVDVMTTVAEKAGFSTADMGVYIQPMVQGVNYHVEFNLFYDAASRNEAEKVRGISRRSVDPLIAAGAFFSRPYGEIAGTIMNKDAATVQALRKVKKILDPDGILNPGKLCF